MEARDDEELEGARAIAASRQWTAERVLADIEQLDLIDSALIESLRAKKAALIPGLRELARSGAGREKANAGLLLLHLGELSGTGALAELLLEDDDELVLSTLASMSVLPAYGGEGDRPLSQRVPVDGAVLWPALARLIESDHDNIAYVAASVAVRTHGMPETIGPTMRALSRDPRPRLAALAIGWLSRRGDPSGLAAIEAALLGLDGDGADAYWCLSALEDYATGKEASVAERARSVAARYIESKLSATTGNAADNDVSNAMAALRGFSSEDAVLETIIASPRGSWVRGSAIRRLAALEGGAALPKLEARLRAETDPVIVKYIAEATSALVEGSTPLSLEARASLRDAIESAVVRTRDPDASRALLSVLVALGGDLGATLQILEARAEGWDRTRLSWIRRRIGAKKACAALAREGIIPAPGEGDLERLARQLKSEGPAVLLFDRLFDAGRMHMFDTEASSVPPDYVDLLGALGKLTKGFAIESPSQDHGPDGILVRFIAGGRLFRFTPRDRGDWFDVGVVIAALDHALELAGRAERFFVLGTDGQLCVVVCAPAAPFRRVAERLAIPLEPDPDAAVRAGVAFEEHVVSRLR